MRDDRSWKRTDPGVRKENGTQDNCFLSFSPSLVHVIAHQRGPPVRIYFIYLCLHILVSGDKLSLYFFFFLILGLPTLSSRHPKRLIWVARSQVWTLRSLSQVASGMVSCISQAHPSVGDTFLLAEGISEWACILNVCYKVGPLTCVFGFRYFTKSGIYHPCTFNQTILSTFSISGKKKLKTSKKTS